MKDVWLISFLAFFGACGAAEGYFVPKGHEATYKFRTIMGARARQPTDVHSAGVISGQVVVSESAAGTRVEIKAAGYSLYIGDDHSSVKPIPEEAHALLAPFAIQRNSEGMSTAIRTEGSERAWSVNFKKALASLMQLDRNAMNKTANAFESEEFTVYGNCPVSYSVVPQNGGNVRVDKVTNPTACKGFAWRASYNLDADHCEKPYVNPLSTTSVKSYVLSDEGGAIFVRHFFGENTIVLSAFAGKSDGYIVDLVHEMEMVGHKELEDEANAPSFKDAVEHKLKVNFASPEDQGSLFDLIGGRVSSYDMTAMVDRIIEGYESIVRRLDGDVKISYDDDDESVHYLMQQIRLLDRKHLEVLYGKLKAKDDEAKLPTLFVNSLAISGTRTAALFIRDLILEDKVTDYAANMLLGTLSFYIKHPNGELLKEMYVLTNTTKESVRKTALLSFATIISKVIKVHPDDVYSQRYIDVFLEKYKSSQSNEAKLLYLSVLKNAKSERAVKFLERLITNHEMVANVSDQFRSLAMWASAEFHARNPEALQMYWAILRNDRENLEVRAGALRTLMMNPTMETLLQLHSLIMEDNDKDLRALFYTHLKNIEKTTAPCFQQSAIAARKLLQTKAAPTNQKSRSFSYIFDFLDELYEFGMKFNVMSVGDLIKDGFTWFQIESSAQIVDFNLNSEAYYIRVNLNEDSLNVSKKFNHMILYDYYAQHPALSYDIITTKNGRVTAIKSIKNDVDKKYSLRNYLREIVFRKSDKPDYSFGIKVDGETVFPTDIGSPAVFFLEMATSQKLQYAFEVEPFVLTYDLTQLNHQIYGLKIYNPIVDVWHGVRRNHVSDTRIPFNITTEEEGPLVMKISNEKEGKIRQYKYETNAFSQVFIESVENNKEKIQQVCAACKGMKELSKEEVHKMNKTLWRHDCPVTDTIYAVEAFDCERPLTAARLRVLKRSFFGDENLNWGKAPLLKIPMAMRHVWAYMTTSPAPERCGLRLSATPKHTHCRITTYSSMKFFELQYLDNETINVQWSVDSDLGISAFPELNPAKWAFNVTQTKPLPRQLCFEANQRHNNLSHAEIDYAIYHSKKNEAACAFDEGPIVNVTVVQTSHSFSPPKFYQCIRSTDTLRACMAEQSYYDKYVYDVNYGQVPSYLMDYWRETVDEFRDAFGGGAETRTHHDAAPPGKASLVVDYEPFSHSFDLELKTPQGRVTYEEVSTRDSLVWWSVLKRRSTLVPEILDSRTLVIGRLADDAMAECYVLNEKYVDSAVRVRPYNFTADWVALTEGMRLGGTLFTPSVDVKQNDDGQKALKVSYVTDTLLLEMSNGTISMLLNDKPLMTEPGYHSAPWFKYQMSDRYVLFRTDDYLLFGYFDGNAIYLNLRMQQSTKGLC